MEMETSTKKTKKQKTVKRNIQSERERKKKLRRNAKRIVNEINDVKLLELFASNTMKSASSTAQMRTGANIQPYEE